MPGPNGRRVVLLGGVAVCAVGLGFVLVPRAPASGQKLPSSPVIAEALPGTARPLKASEVALPGGGRRRDVGEGMVEHEVAAMGDVAADESADNTRPDAQAVPPVPEAPLVESPTPPREEEELMRQLDQVRHLDPEAALVLAREGERRFPSSPRAAERGWVVAKSLVSLKRFEEARQEALMMVQRYPKSAWTLDLKRHLLVYPLGQPSREEMQAQRDARR